MMKKINRYTSFSFKSLLSAALMGAIVSSPALAYVWIDLGANVEPTAINNTGVIVGSSNTDQYPATAFRWTSASSIELINDGISANAVNDNGQIAGTTVDGAFILDGNYRDWSDYGAFGNNEQGVVAGYQVGKNPYQPRSLPFNPAIFDGNKWKVFDIAKLYPRGTRQGVYADRFILNGINNEGYAVGYKYRYGLSGSSAILINTGAPVNDASDVTYLATPYGGRAADINNSNMIVGTTGSNSSTGEYATAFLYDGNTVISLGTLPSNGPGSEPGLTSSAYDINDLNQVVGTSWLVTANTSLNDPSTYHAFLWEKGEMSDLNDLVANLPAEWILTSATAINEYGDIVGVGLYKGITHGFLLTNGTISEPLPVENQRPVAVADANVTSGKAPLTVSFNASASSDPEGSIAAYEWDFMDGKFSSETNPVHVFNNPGKYPVTLTVTDNLGMSASTSITITVRKGKRK